MPLWIVIRTTDTITNVNLHPTLSASVVKLPHYSQHKEAGLMKEGKLHKSIILKTVTPVNMPHTTKTNKAMFHVN